MKKVNFSRKANAGDVPVMKFTTDGGTTWFQLSSINDVVPHLTDGRYKIVGNWITSSRCWAVSNDEYKKTEIDFQYEVKAYEISARELSDEIKRRVQTIVETMEARFPAIDETAEISMEVIDLRKKPTIHELLEKFLPGLEYEFSKVDRVPLEWTVPALWPTCEQVDEFPCCFNEGKMFMIGDKGVYRISEREVSRVDYDCFNFSATESLNFFMVRCKAFEIINKFY